MKGVCGHRRVVEGESEGRGFSDEPSPETSHRSGVVRLVNPLGGGVTARAKLDENWRGIVSTRL